jgi:hypothetical protein
MILPTTPSRAELTARAGQCLNRLSDASFHRRSLTEWRNLLASGFPLTPDTIITARQNVEWMEDALKRMER